MHQLAGKKKDEDISGGRDGGDKDEEMNETTKQTSKKDMLMWLPKNEESLVESPLEMKMSNNSERVKLCQ